MLERRHRRFARTAIRLDLNEILRDSCRGAARRQELVHRRVWEARKAALVAVVRGQQMKRSASGAASQTTRIARVGSPAEVVHPLSRCAIVDRHLLCGSSPPLVGLGRRLVWPDETGAPSTLTSGQTTPRPSHLTDQTNYPILPPDSLRQQSHHVARAAGPATAHSSAKGGVVPDVERLERQPSHTQVGRRRRSRACRRGKPALRA